ncbi:MAG: minor capsid protein [Muribaculaceae bacterium]|nr:minor capsid protein [Muribaculaceae bacterium]
MALLTITTPRGTLTQVKTRAGIVRAQLVWNAGFGRQRTQMFGRVQSFVDSETLRLMQPYTPLRTGMLIKSATLGTVIGSGKIKQITPYAARQYYSTGMTRSYDPRRGAYWFERMKIDHKSYILRGAAQKAGARYK